MYATQYTVLIQPSQLMAGLPTQLMAGLPEAQGKILNDLLGHSCMLQLCETIDGPRFSERQSRPPWEGGGLVQVR